MTNKTLKVTLGAIAGFMLASSAYAAPLSLSAAQMDTVSGGAFVCPVITTENVLNAANGGLTAKQLGENDGGTYYTVVTAKDIPVPDGATNLDGAGAPFGTYAATGDAGYTAIWK